MKTGWNGEFDFIVVGSGAAGATASVTLSEAGYSTLIVEEGAWVTRDDFEPDVYSAMKNLFRDFGAQTTHGGAVMPILEGRCVGGSTVMNGAIVHRLPEQVHHEWTLTDGNFRNALSYSDLEKCADRIERDLSVRRNLEPVLRMLPVSQRLLEKGWAHQAMARNAPGCEGSGRCLQGCPTGGKWSMEKTYVPRAMKAGAIVKPNTRVLHVLMEKGNAIGVDTDRGRFRAVVGVIVAAGVMQTPQLLWRSGFRKSHNEIGKHFQSHLGVGIVARMPRPQSELEGPPQGIEITAFHGDRMKLATQLVPAELLLARTPLVGQELLGELGRAQYYSSWTASIRGEAEGVLSKDLLGGARLRFQPTEVDLARVRSSLCRLSELLFDMGAERVFPGLTGPKGIPVELRRPSDIKSLETMPLNARYFLLSLGHLFGTCRMGSEPGQSVVDLNFQLHGVKRLFVVDASVFPSNLGVNPQHGVMSMAAVAAGKILDLYSNKKARSSSVKKSVADRAERPTSIDW
jgi:choline dehydrogenase-like flavoprotein